MATPHAAATAAATAQFAAGGGALDAAVAASCVLAVAYPHMTGVGGDLFALVARPSGEIVAVNGSGAAPAAIDPEQVAKANGRMPAAGPLTITVPGAVGAWATLVQLGARRGWDAILAPAAALARGGLPVAPSLARALAEERDTVRGDPGLRAVYWRNSAPLNAGDRYRDPELAATLDRLGREGPQVLYRGELGERFTAGLAERGAVLAQADLAAHETEVGPPLVRRYGAAEVCTSAPNSQGCCLLAILHVLERLGLERDLLGPDAGRHATLFAQVTAARDRGLCDPRTGADFADALLGPAGLDRLSAAVAGPTGGGPRRVRAGGDTVAVVAADADGTVVSLIHSLYAGFGSGIREPGTGIVAHNRGASFVLDPGHPNRLAPGRRPAHTLMPVLVRTEGRVTIATGTMGGSAHPQIHTSLLLSLLDGGLDPQAAVARPRWVVGGLDGPLPPGWDGGPAGQAVGTVDAEARVPAAALASIAAAGFVVRRLGAFDEGVGHAQCLRRDARGRFEAGSDPRADGAAAVG